MTPFIPYTINVGGRLIDIDRPLVMGIINATPDSFYADSRATTAEVIIERVRQMLTAGADIIDVGACSTRPGAEVPTAQEECERLREALRVVREVAPEAIVSVDTFRAQVAQMAVDELGADIINDIGTLDDAMWPTISRLQVPYVVMHMRGTPATMQRHTHYPDGVVAEVLDDLARRIDALHQLGVNDVIADPGFGFAKTTEQNYELLASLEVLQALHVPLLVGMSRKSMITRLLNVAPDDALPGTIAAHVIALMAGAHILRVHDVAAAVQARAIAAATRSAASPTQQAHPVIANINNIAPHTP